MQQSVTVGFTPIPMNQPVSRVRTEYIIEEDGERVINEGHTYLWPND